MSSSKVLRVGLGLILVATFWALGQKPGFASEMGRSFVMIGRREMIFWAAHLFLLVPGLLLIFSTLPLEKLVAWWPLGLRRPPRLFGWGLLLVVAATVGARGGRALLLDDLPITGDEHMVLFGARMVAEGELAVPAWDPALGFTNRYLYERDGLVSAMDFPGVIFFRALLLRLGLGFWPFALLAAFSGWALAQALGRLRGRGALGVALAGMLLSPMVLALSLTEHAHLLSRSLVALGWALYLGLLVDERQNAAFSRWSLPALGLLFAATFCTRPPEALAAFAPIFLHVLALAWRRLGGLRAALLMLAAAAAGPALLFLYNGALTGSGFLLPRMISNRRLLEQPTLELIWQRLGSNLGFNAALLLIYFLGPAALAAIACALHQGSAPARVAAAAVGLQLLVGLAHDDTGIHPVGPIHYSEAVVPLLVLVALGWPGLMSWLARCGLAAERAIRLGAALAAGQLVFIGFQAAFLEDQARIQRLLYDAVADLPPAVVITDPLWWIWHLRQDVAGNGTWVIDPPWPDPYFRDRVLFAQAIMADAEALRRQFPQRDLYRLRLAAEGPPWQLERLPEGTVKSPPALDTMPAFPTESGVPNENR